MLLIYFVGKFFITSPAPLVLSHPVTLCTDPQALPRWTSIPCPKSPFGSYYNVHILSTFCVVHEFAPEDVVCPKSTVSYIFSIILIITSFIHLGLKIKIHLLSFECCYWSQIFPLLRNNFYSSCCLLLIKNLSRKSLNSFQGVYIYKGCSKKVSAFSKVSNWKMRNASEMQFCKKWLTPV